MIPSLIAICDFGEWNSPNDSTDPVPSSESLFSKAKNEKNYLKYDFDCYRLLKVVYNVFHLIFVFDAHDVVSHEIDCR